MQNPDKRKQLHEFLTQNNLTQKDYDSFSKQYNTLESTNQLYKFLLENKLTSKNQEDFYKDYFGDVSINKNTETVNIEKEKEIGTAHRKSYEEKAGLLPGESILEKEHREKKLQDQNYTNLIDSFENNTTVSEEEKSELQNEIERDLGNKGVWNTITSGFKKLLSFANPTSVVTPEITLSETRKEAVKKLKEEKIEVNEQNVISKTKELELDKRIKSLKESKERDFLKELSDEEKESLTSYQGLETSSLSKKDKILAIQQDKLRNQLKLKSEEFTNLENELQRRKENNIEIDKDFINQYNNTLVDLKNTTQKTQQQYNEYLDNRTQLEKATDELDLFKRDYGWFTNFIGNLNSSTANIISGVFGLEALANDLTSNVTPNSLKPILGVLKDKALKNTDYFAKDSEKISSEIIRPIGVDDINSISDFGSWLSNTAIAQQIPILALTATGTGGIIAVGGSSAGQKYQELSLEERENADISYSDNEKIGTSLISGTLEGLGAMVDAMILKGTGKILKSATKSEMKMFTKGFLDKAREPLTEFGKASLMEVPEEVSVEFGNNLLDKYVLGKDVDLTEGLKDAAATALVFSVLPGGASVLKNTLKPFTLDSKFDKLTNEVTLLEQQLNNNEIVLSDKVRNTLTNKLNTKKASLEKVVIDISKNLKSLDNDTYIKLVSIEKQKNEIREDVKELEADTSLDKEVKKLLINDFKIEFESLETKRKELLENPNKSNFDNLPKEQQQYLKDQASKELVAEKQEKGKTEFEITDKEITDRAIKLSKTPNNPKPNIYKSVKEKIKSIFEFTNKNQNEYDWQDIQDVTKEESEKLKKELDIDIDENFKHVIETSAITHVLNNHSDPKVEEKRNQIAITKNDFELIPEIINEYDKISKSKDKKGLDVIKYEKTFEDGTTFYLEEVRKGRKKLALKTMYKKKRPPMRSDVGKSTSNSTSETLQDASLSTANIQNSNETQTQGDTTTDTEIQSEVGINDNKRENNKVQPTVNNATNSKPIEVKSGKNNYTIQKENGVLTVKNKKGKEPSAPTKRKILKEHADNLDLTAGEKWKPPTNVNLQEITDIYDRVANESKNPSELAEIALRTNTKEFIEENSDLDAIEIIEYIQGKVKRGKNTPINDGSFTNKSDKNNITPGLAKTYLRKNGVGIDVLAQELSEQMGREVTEQEIIDTILQYPNGVNDVKKEARSTTKDARQRFTEITGLPSSDIYLQKAVEQAIAKEKLNQELYNNYLLTLTDAELEALDKEKTEYEKTINKRSESSESVTNTSSSETKSRVREKTNSTNERKESETEINDEFASQSRTKSLVSERIKPAKKKPSSTPKKLNKIISDVAKNLKATVLYGKSKRRGSIGTYTPSNALVKIRRAGDLDTVAHEIGHLIDDRYNIIGTIEGTPQEINIIRQLKWFSERGGSNPPSKATAKQKRAYLKREGMAEFLRAYVANPKEAKIVAPELFEQFEKVVDTKDLEFLKQFSEDYLNFANASAFDKINSQVQNLDESDKKGFLNWLRGFKKNELGVSRFTKYKALWIDALAIPNRIFETLYTEQSDKRIEKNFKIMARLFSGKNGKIDRLLNDGLVNGKNEIVKDKNGNKINIEYLLSPLNDTSQKTLEREMQEAIALLVSERTIEYAKKLGRLDQLTGLGGGLDSDVNIALEYLEYIEELKKINPEKHQRLKEAANRYRTFADTILQYMVDKGRLSVKDYQTIKSSNQFYVNLQRINELKPTEELESFLKEGGKIGSVKEIIKKAKGGSKFIKNPYVSLLETSVNIIKESDRNELMQLFVEPLDKKRNMGDGTPIDFSKIAAKSSSGEPNTIKVYRKGELEYWQFSQDLYTSLKGLESVASNEIINWVAKLPNLIRNSVTHFPVFALRNAVRDTQSRLILSRSKGNLTDLKHNENDKYFYELYGGSQAGFYLKNKDAYRNSLIDAVKKISNKGGIVLDPRKMFKGYTKLLERGENLNRIAEFKSAKRKALKEGMDEYNANLYAAYQARDLMDFAVIGEYMKTINKLIPFSNAAIQALKRSAKGVKENPGSFALRTTLYTVIPQIAFRLLLSEEDEKEYEELPDYQRDLFYNFKTPMTGDVWITIPKPFELGMGASFTDRLISKVKGNDNALDGFAYSAYNSISPTDLVSLTSAIKPFIEVTANHDFFRDKDIIPYWERGKDLEFRSGKDYASRLGKILSDGFGLVNTEVDPRQIDHVIQGYTTHFGKLGMTISDIGREDSRNQFDFTTSGFAKGTPVYNAKSVKKALDLAKSIGSENLKDVRELKGKMKTYYDVDPKEQRILIKEIYQDSKDLIKKLEVKKKEKLKELKTN